MKSESPNAINERLNELWVKAKGFFETASRKIPSNVLDQLNDWYLEERLDLWEHVPETLKRKSERLVQALTELSKQMARDLRASLLTTEADAQDLRRSLKTMRAALRLRRYVHQEARAIDDEGSFRGFRPESQDEVRNLHPLTAKSDYHDAHLKMNRLLELLDSSATDSASESVGNEAHKYRPNTAFIMMWMSQEHPELEDLREAVSEIFGAFRIRAVRADDLEHEGLITARVLDEIRTSEFLFADLTGMRPNVYYEVGFAHGLGKRVILFRKRGTTLHFDLAGYNCPEYENLKDLKAKLRTRLEALTNRKGVIK